LSPKFHNLAGFHTLELFISDSNSVFDPDGVLSFSYYLEIELLGWNTAPTMEGTSADLILKVGETQILKLKKPEDAEQDSGLETIIKFDGSIAFPSWVKKSGDMNFMISPVDNAVAGSHIIEI